MAAVAETKNEHEKLEAVDAAGMPELQGEGDMQAKMQGIIDANPVVMWNKSTCPFCLEAKRTMGAHGVTGLFVDMDKEPTTAEMRKALVSLADGRKMVPQIFINGQHVGGCDDLKALDASGDLSIMLGQRAATKTAEEAEAGMPEKKDGKDDSASTLIYPGPKAAFFPFFHAPTTVDNRAVRVGAGITAITSIIGVVFAGRRAMDWTIVGLFVDYCFRLLGGGGVSPVGAFSTIFFAGMKPDFRPGMGKMFANLCGTFMAGVAAALLLGGSTIGGRIFLAGLAGAAGMQAFLDFCIGCLIFEYLIKWGFVPPTVYRLHVNTRADTVYAWEDGNIRTGKEVPPENITYPTKGVPPNPTDLTAKPRTETTKWQQFHVIKYCHIGYFSVPLSIIGLALPFNLLTNSPVGTGAAVWQVLAWVGAIFQIVLLAIYSAKWYKYPSKVCKEWAHFSHRNSFAVPCINFLLLAYLCTDWGGNSDASDLAKVLFWLGSAPLAAMSFYIIAGWVALPHDSELINPSWMLAPVGNLVGAVAAKPVDADYYEWGWFLFATGVLMSLALWPVTFGKSITDHHSDFRVRPLYAIWVAAPAVAMLAFASLEGTTELDRVQRLLFYSALALGLVLSACLWPINFFLEGKFDMSAWTFAFPLDALAAASVLAYSYTQYDTMQVIYVVTLSLACSANAVFAFSTLANLKAKHIFTPIAKWSPMSFMKLTHEAIREALPQLEKLGAAAKPEAASAGSVGAFAAGWEALCKAHHVHSRHEEDVIFKTLEEFFPDQTHPSTEEHEEHEGKMKDISQRMGALAAEEDETARGSMLSGLCEDVLAFGKELLEHLEQEEHAFATPIARMYLSMHQSKDLVRKCWEVTPTEEMGEFVAWIMSTLRMRGQRTRFLKTWVWAMPERAHQLGLMVYRGVDDIKWLETARDVPEMVPRGLPGYRRYY